MAAADGARRHLRLLIVAGLVMAALAIALITNALIAGARRRSLPESAPIARALTTPKLYCIFDNFMHSAPVVSFSFAVDLSNPAAPRASELGIVKAEGFETEGDRDGPQARLWTFGSDEGTPTISSPDSSTKIVLYGLKPKTPGTFWIEAGLRSNEYRNLDGHCRQSDFDPSGR